MSPTLLFCLLCSVFRITRPSCFLTFAVMCIACIATGSGYLNYDYNNDDPDTDFGDFCTYIYYVDNMDFPSY